MCCRMTYDRERKPTDVTRSPVQERSRSEEAAPATSRTPKIDLAKIMASIEREPRSEGHLSIDHDIASILDPTVHAAPTQDPNATAVAALHPTLVLWTQRIERATMDIESARHMPGADGAAMIERIIENLEDDEVAGFFLAAADHQHLKHLQPKAVDLPLENLVIAYAKLESTVQAASAQLKKPFELKYLTMGIERATEKFGHKRTSVPPYLPAVGPQREASSWAATQLLDSALADVRLMTTALGARATLLDGRQKLWTETLEALLDVLSSLDAKQRAKLRPGILRLVREGDAFLTRAVSLAPGVPFETNRMHFARLKGFAR